ncbi:MAG: hypothetical protein NZ455_13425 [Bacteroidia bacterium]|nr:hypothetical protein [Bacteroidia bacterium]
MLRATLTLRCCAALRTGLTPTLRMPHASGFCVFYLVCMHTFGLPCWMLIIKYLQG